MLSPPPPLLGILAHLPLNSVDSNISGFVMKSSGLASFVLLLNSQVRREITQLKLWHRLSSRHLNTQVNGSSARRESYACARNIQLKMELSDLPLAGLF